MRKTILNVLALFANQISLSNWQKICRRPFFAPLYHVVSNEDLPHIKHLYAYRGIQEFERDLDCFLQYYHPVSTAEVKDAVYKGKQLPKNAFFLSFDDGLRQCKDIIAPILKRKGIPACFFINTDFVDNKALMFRYKASLLIEHLSPLRSSEEKNIRNFFEQRGIPYTQLKEVLCSLRWDKQGVFDELAQLYGLNFQEFLSSYQPYLDTEGIQDLLNQGFEIGAHSLNHPSYFRIPLEEQIRQTEASQQFLVDHFGIEDHYFAFPFTDFGVSKAFFQRILEQGNFDLCFGGAGFKRELIKGQLQRFPVETDRVEEIESLLKKNYVYYFLKSFLGKNTIRRQ